MNLIRNLRYKELKTALFKERWDGIWDASILGMASEIDEEMSIELFPLWLEWRNSEKLNDDILFFFIIKESSLWKIIGDFEKVPVTSEIKT